MFILVFLFPDSIPNELRIWLSRSFVYTKKADIEFQAFYNADVLKLDVKSVENSYLYLFLKNTRNEMILFNLGYCERGEHIIKVDPEIEGLYLFVELFTSKTPLLDVDKVREKQKILNFFAENIEVLESSWKIVFREDKNATLKIYSDHGESITVKIDGEEAGETPIFIAIRSGIHKLIFTKRSRKWGMLLYLVEGEERELNLSNYIFEGFCKITFNKKNLNHLKVDFENSDQDIFNLAKGMHVFELFGKDVLTLSKNMSLKEDSKEIILDPKKGIASLLLRTQPNSMVFINGTFKGLSDKDGIFLSKGLDQGLVVVKVMKTGFLSEEFPILLKPGINVVNRELSELVKAIIKVNFTPVKLFVDGKYFATLDKNIQSVDLPKGNHILRFENSHCYTIQKDFHIYENIEMSLELQKIPLYIYVIVDFDGKNLKIDLISSEKSEITVFLFKGDKKLLKKNKSINEGHNYIEIKDLKEGDYFIKFLSENISDEMKIKIKKGATFKKKKFLNFNQLSM